MLSHQCLKLLSRLLQKVMSHQRHSTVKVLEQGAGETVCTCVQLAAVYCRSLVLKEPDAVETTVSHSAGARCNEAPCAAEPGTRKPSALQECTLMISNVLQESAKKISIPLMNEGLSSSYLSPSLSTDKPLQ